MLPLQTIRNMGGVQHAAILSLFLLLPRMFLVPLCSHMTLFRQTDKHTHAYTEGERDLSISGIFLFVPIKGRGNLV